MTDQERFSQVLRQWTEVSMQHLAREMKRLVNDAGLSFSHLNILMRLYHGQRCGVSELGDQLGITHAAASQAVDRLVQMKLVVRAEDPSDRRAKQLSLSDDGRALLQRSFDARSQWMERLTSLLTADQQTVIIDALTLLTQAARSTEEIPSARKGRTL